MRRGVKEQPREKRRCAAADGLQAQASASGDNCHRGRALLGRPRRQAAEIKGISSSSSGRSRVTTGSCLAGWKAGRRQARWKGRTVHSFRWAEDMPLNETHFDLGVNLLLKSEARPDRQTSRMNWVTDLELRCETVMQVMRAARGRWRIENETFQTLKRPRCGGCGFEHNFGHADLNLSCVSAMLAMLAFLTDQTQEACCGMFRQVLEARKRKLYLWDRLRKLLEMCVFKDWAAIRRAAAARPEPLEIEAVLPGASLPVPQTGSARPEMPRSGSRGSQIKPRRQTGGTRPRLHTLPAAAAKPAAGAAACVLWKSAGIAA